MQLLYREDPTWLHSIPAWLKLLLLATFGTALFLTDRAGILVLAAVGATGVLLSLRPLSPGAFKLARSIAIGALLVGVFHTAMGQAVVGLASASRLLAMAFLGIALTLSTRHSALLEVFERLLAPLAMLGVRVDRINLLLALMMRFTEQFFAQWKRLDDAHRVRTGRPGGLRLIAPLTIQMLLAARRVGDSLQTRIR
ncbi:energy-coupling factor transporter transmembrane protein EcfT [Hydrogenophaga sp. BPS33]|nr:energy-coupling factor transporter transmembrane protein EcfT [Hydrogenophaga sp. BPS33]